MHVAVVGGQDVKWSVEHSSPCPPKKTPLQSAGGGSIHAVAAAMMINAGTAERWITILSVDALQLTPVLVNAGGRIIVPEGADKEVQVISDVFRAGRQSSTSSNDTCIIAQLDCKTKRELFVLDKFTLSGIPMLNLVSVWSSGMSLSNLLLSKSNWNVLGWTGLSPEKLSTTLSYVQLASIDLMGSILVGITSVRARQVRPRSKQI